LEFKTQGHWRVKPIYYRLQTQHDRWSGYCYRPVNFVKLLL